MAAVSALRNAAVAGASASNTGWVRGSDGIAVQLPVEQRDFLGSGPLRDRPHLVVPRGVLIPVEQAQPEHAGVFGQLPRAVEVGWIVRQHVLVDRGDLRRRDAVGMRED